MLNINFYKEEAISKKMLKIQCSRSVKKNFILVVPLCDTYAIKTIEFLEDLKKKVFR